MRVSAASPRSSGPAATERGRCPRKRGLQGRGREAKQIHFRRRGGERRAQAGGPPAFRRRRGPWKPPGGARLTPERGYRTGVAKPVPLMMAELAGKRPGATAQ